MFYVFPRSILRVIATGSSRFYRFTLIARILRRRPRWTERKDEKYSSPLFSLAFTYRENSRRGRNLTDDCLKTYYSNRFAKSFLYVDSSRGICPSFAVTDGFLGFSFLMARMVASRAALHAICIGDVRFTCLMTVSRCRCCHAIHDLERRNIYVADLI